MKKYIDYMHLRKQLKNLQEKVIEGHEYQKLTDEQRICMYAGLENAIAIIDEMAEINDLCVIGEEQ